MVGYPQLTNLIKTVVILMWMPPTPIPTVRGPSNTHMSCIVAVPCLHEGCGIVAIMMLLAGLFDKVYSLLSQDPTRLDVIESLHQTRCEITRLCDINIPQFVYASN